jgi:hypothetical protein
LQKNEGRKGFENQPFKRGAMTFEDFNYNMVNPYVLVEEEQEDQKNIDD